MPGNTQRVGPAEPPADVPDIQRGNWLALPATDPVVEYVTETLWNHPQQPMSWEVARLSRAAYIYRETSVGWALVAKFYAVKTGSSAHKHAAHELDYIRQIQAADLAETDGRPIKPLAVWRGVLFLEYVRGLTLEDTIAVRRSQPGELSRALRAAGWFLARLHANSVRPDAPPDIGQPISYAHEIVVELARHGVLRDYPIACAGVARLIDRWAAHPAMEDFVPCLNHGDATTTNFVFPEDGGAVVVDWERLGVADPASDLGRLMAEITHSINQHGGNVGEAEPFIEHMTDAYCQGLPADWDADALIKRASFYRASSTLRIARNGWVSRLDRTALVAQAMGLLAQELGRP
jgi:aminoglycoside phosphotransferase (APT) family kinase protein